MLRTEAFATRDGREVRGARVAEPRIETRRAARQVHGGAKPQAPDQFLKFLGPRYLAALLLAAKNQDERGGGCQTESKGQKDVDCSAHFCFRGAAGCPLPSRSGSTTSWSELAAMPVSC